MVIHICPEFFFNSSHKRARTNIEQTSLWIHELSHLYLETDDNYEWESEKDSNIFYDLTTAQFYQFIIAGYDFRKKKEKAIFPILVAYFQDAIDSNK